MINISSDTKAVVGELHNDYANMVREIIKSQVTKPGKMSMHIETSPFNPGAGYVTFKDARFEHVLRNKEANLALLYTEGDKYVLQSRFIRNDKFRSGYRRNEIRSRNPRKIVKDFKTHVRLLKWREVEELCDRQVIERKTNDWRTEPMKGLTGELGMSMYGGGFIAPEAIVHMINELNTKGYEYKDPNLLTFSKRVEEGYEEASRRYQMNLEDVLVVFNGETVYYKTPSEEPTETSSDKLPDELANKVALLRIVEDNTHMPEVGFKIDANRFWVTLPKIS